MTATCHKLNSKDVRQWTARGFTLVEIMVTVALLSVIILGLVAMFNQTRRAFTSSLAQVDVLESGRGAADLIARDLEQIVPTDCGNAPNFYVFTPNYYGQNSGLLVNQLANPADKWTNLIQELFFLTPAPPSNGQWNAIGYLLLSGDEQNSVGTLYRYYLPGLSTTNQNTTFNINNIGNNLISYYGSIATSVNPTNVNRIIDGVTHFRVLAYQANGVLFPLNRLAPARVEQAVFYPGWEYQYLFTSNAVPAYIEIELGILETRALERYRSFGPGTPAATTFLINNPGAVHLFRQRIPIQSVDPAAFP